MSSDGLVNLFKWIWQTERREPSYKLVPVIGVVREQSKPVSQTPQYKNWPSFGVILMAFQLTDSQEVMLGVTILDKKGNPAQVDGIPEWFVDNAAVLALSPSPDGKTCKVSSVGPLGSALVTFKADADLGTGITELVGTLAVEIVSGTATTVIINPGTPTEQP